MRAAPSALGALLAAILGGAGGAHAAESFQRAFDRLVVRTSTVFEIRPAARAIPSTFVEASSPQLALMVPPLLERADLEGTVTTHRQVIAACYRTELETNPGWKGEAILDLVIRRSGQVAEVSVRPEDLADRPLGRCLLRRVARWRFPAFSGETEPGLTREAVAASFPLRFRP